MEAPDPTDPRYSLQRQESQSTTTQQGLSARSSRSPGAESSNAPSSSKRRRTLNQTQGQRGSSRDTAEMHRSSTPPEGSSADHIKYTRTGRVSKATKGQRVHHCEECGKTYTRAEHLRRHQQNHKPGAFPCDWPDCGRSFYREDLLVRHKARHNDPLNPPSRRHSVGSQSSAPDPRSVPSGPAQTPGLPHQPATTDPGLVAPELQPTTSDSDAQQSNVSSRTPKRVPIPPNELPVGVPVSVDGPIGFGQFSNPWDLSSPVSPSAYHEYDYESADETTNLPYYQHHPSRARLSSDTSYLGYGQPHSSSRSPVSAGSSTLYLPQWSFQSGCNGSYNAGAFTDTFGFLNQHSASNFPYGDARALTAETRDFMEQSELGMLATVQQGLSLDEMTGFPDEQRYLNAYWDSIHELYPVIHKPSFDEEVASPLLRAAIFALGGQVSGERNDLSNARTLHEKCLKVLKKRTTQETHTYRVCDMQAIMLIEVFSIFKSRRPPLQLSRNFENVYRLLSNDRTALMSTPMDTPPGMDSFSDDFAANAACRQRLLLACYTLEQQHATLFGRAPTNCLTGAHHSLPFPRAQESWDSAPGFEPESVGEAYERVSEALRATTYMSEPAVNPHDAFQSMIMLASLCDTPNEDLDWSDACQDTPILLATEQSPRNKLAFHTFMLCKNTHIRDLLAVAGESWVMAEKLSTPALHIAAQIETREWATKPLAAVMPGFEFQTQQPPIQQALSHAFRILAIQEETPNTGLLFQEWAVYLAAVVIWARVYVERGEGRQLGLSIPSPAEPRPSTAELNQTVAFLIQQASTAKMRWNDSRKVLLWAKSKMEKYDVPHTCGLTSGALDVLNKIITRGNEDGWF